MASAIPRSGLGIRVIGEITPEKLEIVRESDAILREEIKKAGLDEEIWQYFTVLPGIRSLVLWVMAGHMTMRLLFGPLPQLME